MRTRYAFLFALCFSAINANAQTYCFPFFQNGCWNWHNYSIQVGDINWEFDGDCTNTVHTGINTTLPIGVPVPMTVTSGVWTGCAVWLDMNNDGEFTNDENLYYTYVGGEPHTYQFNITIPEGTTPGAYRMRVLAPWGSDGFLDTNTNGYGACGYFQYGSFTDLTLTAETSTALQEITGTAISVRQGPEYGLFMLHGEGVLHELRVLGTDGRLVESASRTQLAQGTMIDLSYCPAGIYIVHCMIDNGPVAFRVLKQ